MLIVSSYKYSLTPCPLSLFILEQPLRTGFSETLAPIPGKTQLHKRGSSQYAWHHLKKKKRTELYARLDTPFNAVLWTFPTFFGELLRSNKPRCSHYRCSHRTRSLGCARTWRRRGTSSASAGSSGPCPPPSQAPPGKRWTDTSPWCERERWSPSTVETLTPSTRSSRATGLRASRTPSFKTCGWTRTTGRRRGSEGGRWARWRSTGSARSSLCPAPSGTGSRRRIALR